MIDQSTFDILGVGVGPFNLSLAALLSTTEKRKKIKFCDDKPLLQWHPELLFDDAIMQTTYLKDLVTPVDPTNPLSFLNFLVTNGQFYHFLNTSRQTITRTEFSAYLCWVSEKLVDIIDFQTTIEHIEFKNNLFVAYSKNKIYQGHHLSIATGPIPKIPECCFPFLGRNFFHAKSAHLKKLDVTNKRVTVIGGGQTGVEIFRQLLQGRWGKATDLHLVSGRENLLPLDEGPFTNEFFDPSFVQNFYHLQEEQRTRFNERLYLASDGNTASFLQDFYRELYLDKYYHQKFVPYQILPMRWLEQITPIKDEFCLTIKHLYQEDRQEIKSDIIILATGFESKLPSCLNGLSDYINPDGKMSLNYRLESTLPKNHIYLMNFGRLGHGLADPQISLMSWRAATIANDLYRDFCGHEIFTQPQQHSSFATFF